MFIKICGITRLEDADLAASLGASAIGFIFWPNSPRYIAPEAVRDIVRGTASTVAKVGVFVNEPVKRVREIVDAAGLNFVQLHGRESAKYCSQLLTPKIKAIGLKDDADVDLTEFSEDVLILLDAHDPARHGGTGRTVDWGSAREIAASRRTILSGGLNPENVASAIEAVQPYGIDVSSGVESAPGVKDATRMKSFFEALHD